ncbi:MAG: YceI family protein [Deltaproteobacteria bacterium]|nr:YceI family protein [Deltaproteobacteria bacterium]
MRLAVFAFASLAVVSLVSVSACASREAARAPAEGTALPVPTLPVPAIPPVSRWSLDPENSSASFAIRHVLATVRGQFAQPAGTVTFDETAPGNSKVDATIAVSGLSTGVPERDNHLKTPDFFDAARFPSITFASTGFSKSGAGYDVTGNLTMHGITKPVTLAVTVSPPFHHAGGVRRGIEATGTVNRRDFGINWDFPGEASGVVVGDVVKITIDAELVLLP